MLLSSLLLAASVQDPLQVIATVPDLASLAREIGGGAVEVETIVRPGDNPHFVMAKASHLVKLSRADVLVIMGLNYEHAFLPGLMEKCGNEDVLPGGKGFMNVGERIAPLEVPQRLDRAQAADLHPFGNPHYNLDPENGRIMARAVADVLARADPARRDEFERRFQAWDEEARRRIQEWAELMAPLRGARVVVYHRSWSYLAARYGLQVAGEVEPKPGLPPTAPHLAELAQKMSRENVRVLLIEPYYSERSLAGLLESTGARLVKLQTTCGATPETAAYLDWMDQLLRTLAAALQPAAAAPAAGAAPEGR